MSSRNPAAHFPSQTQQYGERVRNIASHWPRLDALNNFLNPNEVFGPDNCDINVLQFKRDSNEPIMFESVSATNLSRYLQAERTWSCRLFVVENISPDVIKQLGGTFDIDPEFFAEHLDEEQWYWVDGVRNVTQPLPSARMEESFFHLRSLQPRAWLKLDHDSSNAFVITEEEADYLRHDPVVCNDLRESRRRTAGVLIPLPRDGFEFEPILLTRQGLTVWFRSEDGGGWTGVICLDPPFQPKDGYCKSSARRNFLPRPTLDQNIPDPPPRKSFAETLRYYLLHQIRNNPAFLEAAYSDAFEMLIDAFHIIASEWMVVEDYLNRELMTVEFRLETSDLSFRDLESLMKGLHTVRRRCTCYQELINNARHFCEARGQPYWPRTTTSSIAEADAALLAKDFEKLAEKMQRIVLRTRKDIKLLIGLVAISQGNVGLQRNLGVERLTVFAALFLPFTTVATVLALPGEFAPGRGRFWVLWAVALPIFVFVCFALGEDFRGEVLKHVQSS